MLLPKMSHYTCIVTYLSYLFFKPIQSKLLLESLSFVKSNFKGCSQSQQVQCFKYFKTYNISCLNAYQKCFDIVELIFNSFRSYLTCFAPFSFFFFPSSKLYPRIVFLFSKEAKVNFKGRVFQNKVLQAYQLDNLELLQIDMLILLN